MPLLRRDHDHPLAARPCGNLACEIVHQGLGGTRLERDFEPPVLAAHEPHVALERELDREIAFARGKRNQILEPIYDESGPRIGDPVRAVVRRLFEQEGRVRYGVKFSR